MLAVLLAPLARGPALRAILFALIAMAVGWVQMAITANTGGSVHHTILLWPFPQLVVAISLAAASRRLGRYGLPVVAAATVVMAVSVALVTNEHHVMMLRDGGTPTWTDAVFPLADYLQGVSSRNIYCVDWGTLDAQRLLSRGKLAIEAGDDAARKAQPSAADLESAKRMVSDARGVYVAQTKAYEVFAGVNERLVKFAEEAGYQRQMLAVISDSYGRQAYEVYRFVRR